MPLMARRIVSDRIPLARISSEYLPYETLCSKVRENCKLSCHVWRFLFTSHFCQSEARHILTLPAVGHAAEADFDLAGLECLF
jgi:hypothetical protein